MNRHDPIFDVGHIGEMGNGDGNAVLHRLTDAHEHARGLGQRQGNFALDEWFGLEITCECVVAIDCGITTVGLLAPALTCIPIKCGRS